MMLVFWWNQTSFVSSSKIHFPQLESPCVCLMSLLAPVTGSPASTILSWYANPSDGRIYAELSTVRVTVEWLFGNIINDFKFLDFKKILKIDMSSVRKMYLVCTLLPSAITRSYGNRVFWAKPSLLRGLLQVNKMH